MNCNNMIINLKVFITVIVVLLPYYVHNGSLCGYQSPKLEEIQTRIPEGLDRRIFRHIRSPPTRLRIHFHYMPSFERASDSEEMKTLILEPARKHLEYMIKAKYPTKGSILIDRQCVNNFFYMNDNNQKRCAYGCNPETKCIDIVVPDKYLRKCSYGQDQRSDGIGALDSDVILLISYEECTDITLAYAASCFSNTYDRPILGVVNLCNGRIDSKGKIFENQKLVQHEIIHALGFSVDKYAFFRRQDGSPIVPRDVYGLPALGFDYEKGHYKWNDEIIKKVNRKRSSVHGHHVKEVLAFVLPTVLEVAREHFGCQSINGVDLEDAGKPGSAETHFDEYFVYNEIMTPETNNAVDTLSKFALAVLKDTGWYDVNFTRADDLEYGKNMGCMLPLEGCHTFMKYKRSRGESIEPFCDRVYRFGNMATCSANRQRYEFCYLTRYNQLLKKNQYFLSLPGVEQGQAQFYAGSSEYNEFCPSKIMFTAPNSICGDASNNNRRDKKNVIPSYFGKDSMCFNTALLNDPGNVLHGGSCQKYVANETSKTIIVYINDEELKCPSEKSYKFETNSHVEVNFTCPENLNVFFPKNKQNSVTANKIIVLVLPIVTFLTSIVI